MGISLKDIFKSDEERLVENKRKTAIKNMIIFICVIFVLVIAAVIIRFWGDQDEVRRLAITKDIQNIKTAVLSHADRVAEDPTLEEYPGKSLESDPVTLNVNGITMEYRYGYYLLEAKDLKRIAVSLNLPDEIYIVNYKTGDVVNAYGIKYKSRLYYTYEDLVAIEKGETPTSEKVVVISTASDLEKIRTRPSGHFKLSANIDMSDYTAGEGWEPISVFTGIFDGRGYTISNLKINRTTQSYVGLFGDVKSTAKISNLKLENVSIIGGEFTGALAGNCSGAISNIHVKGGEITGFGGSTGGLVGTFSIEGIDNCTVNANVDGDRNVGGVIGTLYNGIINRVSANGNVTATENVGGLIGLARISEITQIGECAAHVAVNGKNNLGGLIGAVEMTASRNLEISNSYAEGSIETGENNIGGMFGQIYTIQGTPSVILENLYGAVSVVEKGETSGGFIGYCRVGGATTQVYDNCFWEKNLAPGEVLNDVGKSSEGSTMTFVDRTQDEMKMMRMYTTWDFESVWEIAERKETPTLRWEKKILRRQLKMKNNGITIITLIVMIAVIIILTSIFMATGLDSLDEAKNAEIQNEMYQLKQAVVNRYTSYEKNDGNIALMGTLAKNKWSDPEECIEKVIESLTYDDETAEEEAAKEAKIGKEISADYDKFVMLVDSGDRIKLGLENSSDNVYIVNYHTGAVYGPIEE